MAKRLTVVMDLCKSIMGEELDNLDWRTTLEMKRIEFRFRGVKTLRFIEGFVDLSDSECYITSIGEKLKKEIRFTLPGIKGRIVNKKKEIR